LKTHTIIGSLIGNFIKIAESKNSSLKGIKGKVIDETKNTLTLKIQDKQIKIIKNQVKIKNEN